MESKILKYHLL